MGKYTPKERSKPSKESKLYFDAYRSRPKSKKVYDIEEKKQPEYLPPMTLLESIHGISTDYSHNHNAALEELLDAPALLCLGILIEEYTKYQTTDQTVKFNKVYFDS